MSRAHGWLLCLAWMAAWPVLPAEPEHDPDHASGDEHADHASHAAAGSLPRTPIAPITAADRIAALPPKGGEPAHDNSIHTFMLVDRLERWDSDAGSGFAWQAEGWIGTDLHRAWLRSSGEDHGGRTEAAEMEVLYGRSIAAWWDLVGGVRHDFRPGGARSFLALGVQGLAPQNVAVEATAYLRDGQIAARLETTYQLLFTNRLILQPHLELQWFGEDEPQRGIGSGLATLEAGMRLRYEIVRRFAPYAGIGYHRALGETGDLRREAGEDADDLRLVAGIRMWF
ncbi:MAG: copper resistance protein B [Pseudomonadota bacterium]|nr:copper resistance protein B [Pseudomonadota bacterium]